MLPGPLLKAEPLVVIIKDGGSVVGFAKGAWRGEEVGGGVTQGGETGNTSLVMSAFWR